MHRVITIHLHGHPTPYELDDDAYDALRRYLDDARAGLTDETDPGEVLDDLEQSIGTKLADRLADRRVADDRILATADVHAVLAAVGPVGGGDDRTGTAGARADQSPTSAPARPRRRRLYRIRADQQIAGV